MNDIEQAWHLFIKYLQASHFIKQAARKDFAGLPFIYLESIEHGKRKEMDELLKTAAMQAMKGKRLTLSISFVRESKTLFVYRVRFLVPQRKMFCCGNMCHDCIRFTS